MLNVILNCCYVLLQLEELYGQPDRCQQLFRPDLERDRKVIVVLSNNDGCVVARSAEAKALGIQMGVPWFELKDIASKHGIVAFSSNYALYADMSNRLMHILSGFSPVQEVYSIDECFLDLTGFTDVRDRAYAMREKVRKWTGLVVCVGIGPSKTLAKLANNVAKSFISLTKYPSSLLFLLQTLGIGAILLALFERLNAHSWLSMLAVFGAAPMFFYILHMYVLRVLYHIAFLIYGATHGVSFGLDNFNWIWLWYLVLLPLLYVPTAWYSRLKARRRDIAWLKYF